MRLFEIETDENAVYFCFINANPPTFGYTRAINTLNETANGADTVVFVNPAQHGKLYPLEFKQNIKFVKRIFPSQNFDESGTVENPIQALKKLKEKYNKVYFLTRDHTVNDMSRMYTYASEWNIDSFEVIGLGDSKRPLPTGTSKESCIEAVLENDYEKFKKTIPSNDRKLLADLFMALRKSLISNTKDDEEEKVDEAVNTIFASLYSINESSNNFITESCNRDVYGNGTFMVENIIDSIKNLKLIFSRNSDRNVKMGKDTKDNNYVIIMKCGENRLGNFLDLNEGHVKNAIRKYVQESVTSANVASTSMIFGDIVKRDIDYSEIEDMEFDDASPHYVQAVNKVLNQYGYMDSETAQKLRSFLK